MPLIRSAVTPKANPRAAQPVPRPASFALAAALAGFALAAFSPGVLNDGDTYWHIRAGEWMLAHHSVLRFDIFSYTLPGAPWHTQEWLAEVLMALAWAVGGWIGIHLLFGASMGLAAGLVGYFLRKRLDLVPAVLAAVLGLSCVSASLLARPHLLTLPLLAAWTWGLVAALTRTQPVTILLADPGPCRFGPICMAVSPSGWHAGRRPGG